MSTQVEIIRANVTQLEGQKIWDEFCYLMSLALKEHLNNGGDISILNKREEFKEFEEWYDYLDEYKRNQL